MTECMKVSTNDDSIAATSDWQWMTLMRLGRKAEAAKVLERITPKMEILENGSYHRRLLMYKGLEKPEALLDPGEGRRADDRDAGLRRRQLVLRHRRSREGARDLREGRGRAAVVGVRLHRGRSRPGPIAVGRVSLVPATSPTRPTDLLRASTP